MEKGKGKRVAVVGHFPLIPKIKKSAGKLWVVEKKPKEGDIGEADADNLIPRADVVAITGTTLTNHTMKHLLERCNPKAYVIALGDTAPLSTILFDYGLDAISGSTTSSLTPQQTDCSSCHQCIQNTKDGKYQGKPPSKIDDHHWQHHGFYGTVRKEVRQVKVRSALLPEGF